MNQVAAFTDPFFDQLEYWENDFEAFALDNLTIRTKPGELAHLKLNRAQLHIHEQVERQRAETGKVRAVILKGRQQGCSTYVEARFYWKTMFRQGVRAFILAHQKDSTEALYQMAQRYHDNNPIAPHTGTSNAKELVFDQLDSGYRIGTAGNDTIGRGTTLQYFHGSEVAYWPSRSEGEISSGVLQAVADVPDTEIFLESTANGTGGYFHSEVIKAMKGEGDYQLIFVPWFWQEEYRSPAPADFEPTEEERALVTLHGLDPEQLMWRRKKIIELATAIVDGLKVFQREYPNTINEAFQNSVDDGMIKASLVSKARAADCKSGNVLVVGVDPSRGGDRFSVIRRRGRVMFNPESFTGKDSPTGELNLGQQVRICKKILDAENPDRMFIDGASAELVDRLHELGYRGVVKAVKFGSRALDPEKYRNRRCEIWGRMAEWLADEDLDSQLPDDDALEADLLGPRAWYDSQDRLCMESKDDMKKRGVPSPDLGDAAALTFSEQVIHQDDDDDIPASNPEWFQ